MPHSVSIEVGGKPLTIETGQLAGMADGAVTVTYGETVVLVTACISSEPRAGADFLPLTVDYDERLYAAGKIPGGFIKREGRPTQDATLLMRLVDRAIRPLFPQSLRNEIQIIVAVLSADRENDYDILAVNGASAALCLSSIPFKGPVAATRVGYRQGQYLINPTHSELQDSELDVVVAGSRDAVDMVEAGANQVPEDILLEAIRRGQEVNREVIRLQEDLARPVAKTKMAFKPDDAPEKARVALEPLAAGRIKSALALGDATRRDGDLKALKAEVLAKLGANFPPQALADAWDDLYQQAMRAQILDRSIRPDGRALSEIRPISAKAGILPRTHGTGLFQRGQTQVLTIATLGSLREEQRLDGLDPEESKRYMHHYNFPPFSTGETGRMGTPRRREIGHGALAERALEPVIPDTTEFPYTIRLVSEVLSSNGSTSMAAVCGSTLSLLDAGVPIKAPVAGIAMGLIVGEGGRFAVLTDIAGKEDALGDMDFKVAGTAKGVTALQLDIKVLGISLDILRKALEQAREARLFILKKMEETIATHRPELSKYAPRMYKIKVDPEKIRVVIGPGGRTIRSIQDETKATVDVENDGTIIIGSSNEEMAQKAISMIDSLTQEAKVGGIYTGKVTRTVDFGAFVEILPGKEGLVRLAELADYPAPSVEDVVKVGDEITVMVTEIDHMGRVNLSRRALLQKDPAAPGSPSGAPEYGFRSHGPRPGGGPPRRPFPPRQGGPRGPGGGYNRG